MRLFIALVKLLRRVVQATNLSRLTTNDESASIWYGVHESCYSPYASGFLAVRGLGIASILSTEFRVPPLESVSLRLSDFIDYR